MPGYLAHDGAVTICLHAGRATPTVLNPRVKVSGRATVVVGPPWAVAGCAPAPGTLPCATGQWTASTSRIRSLGLPLVIQGGTAVCVPTGGPLLVTTVQARVRGV
ncbi:hypothetical protein ABT147_40195 [Streptomyces sp. NPDC001868]|uniref:hypothetical protein n=1 Tax=Streptomyces TaxID=1883 RepID=UPI002E0F57CC|nr:hypothetical protein OHB30_51465 [Streptomyces europaeiscabiei]